jgi:hypothetical protein
MWYIVHVPRPAGRGELDSYSEQEEALQLGSSCAARHSIIHLGNIHTMQSNPSLTSSSSQV